MLTAVVPAQATAYPEQIPVVVSNGASSGPSNAVTFTVTPPTTQVFYLTGRRGGTANGGIAVDLPGGPVAAAALNLTQPLSLSVATTATPPSRYSRPARSRSRHRRSLLAAAQVPTA